MNKKENKKPEQEELEENLEAGDLEEPLVDVGEGEDILIENQLLRQQLEEMIAEAAKNLDGWQRTQAEFINYRKRIDREQSRMNEDAAARVIKRFLPVLDDLARALQDRPKEGDAADWAGGIELIYRKLGTILENEGVTVMQAEGQFFDPNLHEAISQSESPDHESGQIIEVIQQGYMIGERVLRAALVRVAS